MDLLRVSHLTRRFGAVTSLLDVNFAIQPGEVLGVVGQLGAGKSTLFNLLGGSRTPSGGEIVFDGHPVVFRSTQHAQQMGIVAVHQPPQLVDTWNVLHNIFLGCELAGPRWLPLLPRERQMLQIARDLLSTFGLSPRFVEARAGDLNSEQRHIVSLVHALCHKYRLFLFDDPLAALSFPRQQVLLDRIRRLRDEGVSVIMGGDDLNQIFAVTDAILVLYQGRQVAFRRTSDTTPRDVVELIVGSSRQERVTPMIWAFENYHKAQMQTDELRRAQQELRQSLEAQDSLNRELIKRLNDQLEALDSLNLALQEASRRLITEREAERKALARELHDQIIQDLLSYNYQLEEIEAELATEAQQSGIAQIRDGIRAVVGSLRQVCSDLRPPTIDYHGLSSAIRSLTSQWSEQTGISVDLDMDAALGRLPEPIELSVFRIVQEGFRNVEKHADATQVRLVLHRTPTASLVMRLADNGQGMPAPVDLAALTERKHFGLVGISERVSLLRGDMRVTSPPQGGLTIDIEIPSPYPTIEDRPG